MKLAQVDEHLYEQVIEKLGGHASNYDCPMCGHRDCMLVFADGWFNCLSCGERGTHKKLLWKLGASTEIVATKVSDKQTFSPPWRTWLKKYGTWEEVAISAYKAAKNFPALISYLNERKIGEFAKQGKFGWLGGYLTFPVFDRKGNVIDLVVRSTPSKKNQDLRYATRPREKDEGTHLYCPDWQLVDKEDYLILPFGLLDAWSIYAAGFPVATGISGQMVQPELLKDFRKKIYIIPDRDEIEGANRLKNLLDWRGVVVRLDYPEGCKDPNDIHQKHGVKTLKQMIGEKL